MLLRWILYLLGAYLLLRLVRALLRPSTPPKVTGNPPGKLDPERAVSAQWSEVRDESEEDSP